jgi:Metallo-peptidase family M12B Reprolysin-like/Secretion system C-terminal sorting domain
MKKLFLLTVFALHIQSSFAQSFWENIPEASISVVGQRYVVPQQYHTAWLNVNGMESFLADAPERFTPAALETSLLPVLTLPTPEGRTARFRLAESPVMHPDLQAQYPEIRCYTGYGIDDPTAVLKCDLTPWGFHAMVLGSQSGAWFIEPYSHGDRQHYMVYYKKDHPRPADEDFVCGTEDREEVEEIPLDDIPEQGDCQFRRYRLAVACTGEYAAFHGGTAPLALAAIVTSVNRVVGVYETEVGVTMQLIANNNLLVYLDAGSDPYTNNDASAMLNQNRDNLNTTIGNGNFDIGHVFSTAAGGVAGLGVVCNSSNKARGVTGIAAPIGDLFDIDYVAHEMGHQFSGNHSFNGNAGSCNGNLSTNNAMEAGSGQTIMAYAGICGAQNSANRSDAYFHAISLQNIGNFVTGAGHTCDQIISTANSAPTVNGGSDYTVPRSTPFALTATGNAATFCWEQMDNALATYPITSTNPQGPNFRSFFGTASPTRFFPRLADIVSNANPAWEVLPSIARTFNFRVTGRNVGSGYGCTAEDNVVVTVNGVAGPFLVTAPNTNTTWIGGTTQTVTWDVAGTTANSVNCANVKISLSTDGGFTYPTVLLESTPNNGSATVTSPNISATTCRIKVEGVGNIFFDISNVNFTISFNLPVELTDFEARLEGNNNVLLQWATASEKNNQGFDIEMKNETDPDFQRVGFQPGNGTNTERHTYNYLVRNLKDGTWYFRLKQVDFDGNTAYSPVRSVQIKAPFSVSLFPNPVRQLLNVVVFSEKESTLTFELLNQLGQRFDLLSQEQTLQRGHNSLQFDVSALPAGIYYYVCRSEEGVLQGELVVE